MGTPRCGVPDVLDEQLVDDQEILDVGDALAALGMNPGVLKEIRLGKR